jgi:hypothetical protein
MKQTAILWRGPDLIALTTWGLENAAVIAFSLQQELRLFDAPRNIHGQCQQVDLLGSSRERDLDQRERRAQSASGKGL